MNRSGRSLAFAAVLLLAMLFSTQQRSVLPIGSSLSSLGMSSGHSNTGRFQVRPSVISVQPTVARQAEIRKAYGKLPLSFVANRGQSDNRVRFLARGNGYTLFLTPDQAVLALLRQPSPVTRRTTTAPAIPETALHLQLVGADRQPRVVGLDELPGTINDFQGNDPSQWHADIPTYAKVAYLNVYPGIDQVYHGNQGQLEDDFLVAPHADPTVIRLKFVGADNLEVGSQGNLVVHVASDAIRLQKPTIYQEISGQRRAITGGYQLVGGQQVTFRLGPYDATQPLVIDPLVDYSTYLGGSGSDQGIGVTIDAAGDAYVTGITQSVNFPTTVGTVQTTLAVPPDAFVVKLNPSGTGLIYSTYFGGNSYDQGNAIAADAGGNAYVTGFTSSTNFPTTTNAFQTTLGGSTNAFVTKLNPDGDALLYSTYLGGTGPDLGRSLVVDASGHAYVTGVTSSPNFPTVAGAFQTGLTGSSSAFVTKLNPSGTALVYSTYVGGSDSDGGNGIAMDPAGSAYITGYTYSSNFPTTPGAVQTAIGGNQDAFATKLNPTGSALVYSTYLGGGSPDLGTGITVDASGNAYLTGSTSSPNFPTTPGAFQTTLGGSTNAFVAKLNPDGNAFVYSTFLGGNQSDDSRGIAVDAGGNAYITGTATSSNFPTTSGAVQTASGGIADAYVTKLNRLGSALSYSSYLGGNSTDGGYGIAVDAGRNAYVTGVTYSTNFPTTTGAFQTTIGGISDAFVTKIPTYQLRFPLIFHDASSVSTSLAARVSPAPR